MYIASSQIIPINSKLSTVFVDFIDELDIVLYNINEGSDSVGIIQRRNTQENKRKIQYDRKFFETYEHSAHNG